MARGGLRAATHGDGRGAGTPACSHPGFASWLPLCRAAPQLKLSLQAGELVVAPPLKEATKLLAGFVKNVAESGREFVRWMDGTCLEMPDQRPRGEEGEPLVITFSSEVVRIQPVGGAAGGAGVWRSCGVLVQGSFVVAHTCMPSRATTNTWGGRGSRVLRLAWCSRVACAAAWFQLRLFPPPAATPQIIAAAVTLHQDISRAAGRVTKHLEGWRNHADIWKQVGPRA